MTQVWVYNENKVFVESKFVEKVVQNMTTVPLLVGYIKPTFTGREWIEGATDEEIKEWEEVNKPPQELIEEKASQKYVEELERKLIDLEIKMYEYL